MTSARPVRGGGTVAAMRPCDAAWRPLCRSRWPPSCCWSPAVTTTTRRRSDHRGPHDAAGPPRRPARRRDDHRWWRDRATAGRPTTRPPRTRPTRRRACAKDKTLSPGKLVVATGQPAFGPYVIDDKPESGQGSRPTWPTPSPAPWASPRCRVLGPHDVRRRHPARPKDFDFNLQQYSINPDREKVVTFSDPTTGEPGDPRHADSPAATATSADDFRR